jgi:hypothetical protein
MRRKTINEGSFQASFSQAIFSGPCPLLQPFTTTLQPGGYGQGSLAGFCLPFTEIFLI